jgi:hypothetical protein
MIDWTTVLVGIGTSLIATGVSGLLKTAYIRIKNRRAQASLKKSTNRTNLELKPYKKVSSVELKDSTNSPAYILGSYSKTTHISPTNDYHIDILDMVALTHPDSDHFQGLILAPHHGGRTIKKNP